MSTTVARPAAAPRTLPPQWRRSYSFSAGVITYVGKWFWAVILLAVAAAFAVAAWLGGSDASFVQFAQHGGIWFPFSLMIMLPPMLLPAFVVGGMTRRAFATGTLLTALSTAAVFAVAMIALLALERWVFGLLGWQHGRVDELAAPALGAVPGHLWGLFLIYAVANVCGLLVSVVYFRYGGLWGTVALPLTIGPIALTGIYALDLESSWRPWIQGSDGIADWLLVDLGPLQPVLGLGLAALAALAYARILLTLPVPAKES